MRQRISQKSGNSKQDVAPVREEFTGRNLSRFGASGLIRRFFKRRKIQEMLNDNVEVESRRKSKYSVGTLLISCL